MVHHARSDPLVPHHERARLRPSAAQRAHAHTTTVYALVGQMVCVCALMRKRVRECHRAECSAGTSASSGAPPTPQSRMRRAPATRAPGLQDVRRLPVQRGEVRREAGADDLRAAQGTGRGRPGAERKSAARDAAPLLGGRLSRCRTPGTMRGP